MDITASAIPPVPWDQSMAKMRAPGAAASDVQLRAVAEQFETTFLAEMLKHTGLGELREGFNGGAGEAAFSGFLTWEYAESISAKGTFGLADKVYSALRARNEP